MMSKQSDSINFVKNFIADHNTIGFVETYKKYFHENAEWLLNDTAAIHGNEAIVNTIATMDTIFGRPYARIEIRNIGAVNDNTVIVWWIEHTHNKDTGRIPYHGENNFSGEVIQVITVEGNKIIQIRSYYDLEPYFLPTAMPSGLGY